MIPWFRAWAWISLLFWSTAAVHGRPVMLPIYIEESHAGSFYWFGANLSLDEPHCLVLIDAHSDASAVFGSDRIRQSMRSVKTRGQREELFALWRRKGAIQCYDWVEPLMPSPIASVLWIPAQSASGTLPAAKQRAGARLALDYHEETQPREIGSLAAYFDLATLDTVVAQIPDELPVVVSLDLDWFAEIPEEEMAARFRTVFDRILQLPRLRALTVAVSPPYLQSRKQQERLLFLLLEDALNLGNAKIIFEPYAQAGPDRSLKTRELLLQRKPIPRLDPAEFPMPLAALLYRNRDRIAVAQDLPKWAAQLSLWEHSDTIGSTTISVRGHAPGSDGIYHIDAGQLFDVSAPALPDPRRLIWKVIESESSAYNMIEGLKPFATEAPRWIRCNRRALAFSGGLLPSSVLHDSGVPGLGRFQLLAEVETPEGRIISNTVTISQETGVGFQRALSSYFGMPYVYGAAALASSYRTGPETGLGSDCSNFLIAALRRQGMQARWGNPAQLEQNLSTLFHLRSNEELNALQVPISAADLSQGLILSFGNHAAALWQDNAPMGILDRGDSVAHHLEGYPEIAPLGKLLEKRSLRRVLQPVSPTPAATICLGGDIMLARSMAGAGDACLTNPFLNRQVPAATVAVANLECALSSHGSGDRFRLVAPAAMAKVLQKLGFDAVSLANNHSGDAGAAGYRETAAALEKQGIATFGSAAEAGSTIAAAGNLRIGLAGFFDRGSPDDLDIPPEWLALIRKLKQQTDFVIVLPHWGEEHSIAASPRQRTLARALVDAGADFIAGSGPHCVQPCESISGVPVYYSLGNLVFDGRPQRQGWDQGEWLEIQLDAEAHIIAAKVFPYRIGRNGLPE